MFKRLALCSFFVINFSTFFWTINGGNIVNGVVGVVDDILTNLTNHLNIVNEILEAISNETTKFNPIFSFNSSTNSKLDDDFHVEVGQQGVDNYTYPSILFYKTTDNNSYCFNFMKSFEALYYYAGNYSIINNTEVDYRLLQWNFEITEDYDFVINAKQADNTWWNTGLCEFEHVLNKSTIKFNIVINNYTWSDVAKQNTNNSKFVLVLYLNNCTSIEHFIPITDGIAVEVTSEYVINTGYLKFSTEATATSNNTSTTIKTQLYKVYLTSDMNKIVALHLVFDFFGKNVEQDPILGCDESNFQSKGETLSNLSLTTTIILLMIYLLI